MAGSSNTPLSRTSTPPTDPLFHSDPLYSAPNPASSPRLPAARPAGAFLSGRVPVSVNGTSGGGCGAAAPHTECKMVEVHGVKVASFTVNGVELICLPQVFELFLKHLVGGLHTVYTKLKRLDISPVVCTVEQVRVLRGLGAIQPGVNRCKLITRADFETLYRDCTNASSRPGRPPKRTLGVATVTDGSRLLSHGLISPALLSQTGVLLLSAGLTAAAMAEALKLQKMRMMMGFHGNCDQQQHHNNGAESDNDTGGSEASWEKERRLLSPPPSSVVAPPPGSASLHLNTLQQHSTLLANRLSELPFMVMPHPLLPVGLPPASVAMAMNQMSHLSGLANMAAMSHVQREESKESPLRSPSPSDDELRPQEPTSQSPSRASSSSSSSPPPPARTPEPDGEFAEREHNTKKVLKEKDDSLLPLPLLKPTYEKLPLTSQPLSINHANPAFGPFLLAEGLSSMETLLTNIQGLLKVAVQSARSHDKQNQMERKELKLELERERDARQTLQRQLSSELQSRVSIQRRLKKEKKAKRKLQEALDFESRRREQVERALKHSDSLTDAGLPENELENQQENSAARENRVFIKPPLLF
ncbi:dachshund a isoform X2 [Micropterus dolomieu]|uniref:dachshund a isoform X2 n=1 Tax=Micropterus dolomieu TaxID=147949 RepID=UPI001E8CB333|nr:dachshund a isoform X2 [Micropterus dolomieu]